LVRAWTRERSVRVSLDCLSDPSYLDAVRRLPEWAKEAVALAYPEHRQAIFQEATGPVTVIIPVS